MPTTYKTSASEACNNILWEKASGLQSARLLRRGYIYSHPINWVQVDLHTYGIQKNSPLFSSVQQNGCHILLLGKSKLLHMGRQLCPLPHKHSHKAQGDLASTEKNLTGKGEWSECAEHSGMCCVHAHACAHTVHIKTYDAGTSQTPSCQTAWDSEAAILTSS